jgi:outer membrane protein OmpA-like peptidoglycan-associated protein
VVTKPVAMKPIKFFALVGIITSFCVVLPTLAEVKQQTSPGQFPNYVVIGAFAVHKNAIKFTHHASTLKMSAKFEMNPSRNLYYVYVLSTEDRETAIREANKLRAETEFTDTWVYSGQMGKFLGGGSPSYTHGVDINPVTQNKMEIVPTVSSQTEQQVTPGETNAAPSTEVAKTEAQHATAGSAISVPVASLPASSKADTSDEIDGKSFVFNISRSVDHEKIEGDIDVIDPDKSKKVGTFKGNIPVRITSPGNKSGTVSLVCEVFGYRKLQKDIDYTAPQGEGITTEDGSVTVPVELVRLQKGDIAVMYNVYFFKDAAIMRPESRFEVNSLLEMLKENPKYRIRIHGHTNGGSHGKIISMGESKSFFSLNGSKEGFGSAKKLSEERARVIHNYLTENGIEAHRTHVKAWGGKRPIHDKHSTRASENVRVEIEILEDK